MPDDPTLAPCVIYGAKSTEDKHGSIPTQLEDARALARREGWEVIDEFTDEAFSGYSGNRGPGLEAAKALAVEVAVEKGECVLVAQDADRFARGAGDAPGAADHLGEIFFAMRRQSVELWTVRSGRLDGIRAFIEGDRAHGESERKQQAVSAGKDRQFERGERLGGPVPDGLKRIVERDPATDNIASRRYVRDDERAPVIERMFELSEQGHGDNVVARTLNEEGTRTKAGKPWTRRGVQHVLLNPIYAGRVRRETAHGKKLDEPAVTEATNIEPLIDPDRYDRITAARAGRDRMKTSDPRRRGGRPTSRYALAKLAVCDRCGSHMYARTSPYKRKDGSHARHYFCGNVHGETGLCDAPKVNAERVDTAVIAYLDDLFVDFEAWQAEVARGRASKRDAVEGELRRAQQQLDAALRRDGKLRRTWMDADEDSAAHKIAEASFPEVAAELADARARVERLEAALAAEEASAPTTDDMLDLFNDLAESVRGGGDSMRELNERLRTQFEAFRMDTMPDGSVGVQPVLLPRPAFDAHEAFAKWVEAGEPEPDEAEAERAEREGRVEDAFWVTGQEKIRPPARALEVAMTEMGPDTQP